ncbi:hypothetical protein AALP_AA6G235700 [Arabis alpina]|uniref:Uncharacterized protein n=1 Tax=Arabis alpina TaxID=50452 RepID=A0A087GR90_ARAAL|nr:hypothetical protein AALP_AA6G235700 [Arabis alpina]
MTRDVFPCSDFVGLLETGNIFHFPFDEELILKVGMHFIVDATAEEESHISSPLSISMNRVCRTCSLIKRGGSRPERHLQH